jgi:hypothetical protein
MSIPSPNKGGRPRKHSSNAARIAAWRAKRKPEVSLQAPLGEKAELAPPETASKADWNKYLSSIGLKLISKKIEPVAKLTGFELYPDMQSAALAQGGAQ